MTRPGRVILFGATSYLGEHVIEALLRDGAPVIAVSRNTAIADILLHRFASRIMVCDAQTAGSNKAAAVVNLAYLKQSVPVGIFTRNRALVDSVHDVAVRSRAERLVHVSSAAVFGYDFRAAPIPGAAPHLSGDSYLELKGAAERHLRKRAQGAPYTLAIVRPGNIVGRGSPTWVAAVAQRLLDGRPVCIAGADGFSNATDAVNLADYLRHLLAASPETLRSFGVYHHVAEFSSVRWSTFINLYKDVTGVRPVKVAPLPAPSRLGLSGIASAVVTMYRGGSLGVWTRRFLGHLRSADLGERLFMALKTRLASRGIHTGLASEVIDRNYFTIMSAQTEFRSHVLPDWQPPMSLENALARMQEGLAASGYASHLALPSPR